MHAEGINRPFMAAACQEHWGARRGPRGGRPVGHAGLGVRRCRRPGEEGHGDAARPQHVYLPDARLERRPHASPGRPGPGRRRDGCRPVRAARPPHDVRVLRGVGGGEPWALGRGYNAAACNVVRDTERGAVLPVCGHDRAVVRDRPGRGLGGQDRRGQRLHQPRAQLALDLCDVAQRHAAAQLWACGARQARLPRHRRP